MLGRLTKAALLLVAVFATVWLLMISYWQSTERVPSAVDVGLGLFALPASLLLGIAAARAMARRRAESAKGEADASAAHPAPTAEESDRTREADATSPFGLAVLAECVRTAHGASVADLAAALVQGMRPEPDPDLKTNAGFSLLASRVPDVDGEGLREQLADLPLARCGDVDVDSLGDDYLRALYLLSEVQGELLDHALRTSPLPDTERRVSLLLPARWRAEETQLAIQCLQKVAAQVDPQGEWRFDLPRAADADADPWMLLARIDERLNAASAVPGLWLLMAGESFLSPECVAQWEAQGRLHAGGKGLIPGEAAAGLLLCGAVASQRITLESVPPLLSKAVQGRLDESADARQLSRATVLAALADQALHATKLHAADIQWVVSDADQRASRVTEVAKLLNDKLPHVPFDTNNLLLGASCGHTGMAAPLLTLALGAHVAQQERQPVLVASVGDAHARSVVLVSAPPKA